MTMNSVLMAACFLVLIAVPQMLRRGRLRALEALLRNGDYRLLKRDGTPAEAAELVASLDRAQGIPVSPTEKTRRALLVFGVLLSAFTVVYLFLTP
jgi:hypothetical protein